MLPLTAPVPQAKDTGAKYKEHVVSSGPYKFDHVRGRQGLHAKRNPNWDQATDPNRKALPDGYEIKLGVAADDIDNQLDRPVTSTSTSPAPACSRRCPPSCSTTTNLQGARGQPGQPAALVHVDHANVAPLDNVALPHRPSSTRPTAPVTSSPTAASRRWRHRHAALLPRRSPATRSSTSTRPAPTTTATSTKAKDELTQCGKPTGFKTTIAYRADRPEGEGGRRVAAAVPRQGRHQADPGGPPDQRLLHRTPASPTTCRSTASAWPPTAGASDWNDGYGMLGAIVDSRRHPRAGGSTNLERAGPGDRRADRQGLRGDRTQPSANRSGARSTRRSWRTRSSCPASGPSPDPAQQERRERLRQRGVRPVRLPRHGRRSDVVRYHQPTPPVR